MRDSGPGLPLPARAKMRVSGPLRPVWDSIGGQPWSVSSSVPQNIGNGHVFRDLEEAKAWLGLPADLGDPFEDMAWD